jgi:hypothetical protein
MVPADLLFWVAPLDRWVDQQAGVMCRRHADSIVVPVGWTYDDRREVTPRLFRTVEAVDVAEPPVRVKRSRPSRSAAPEPVALPLDEAGVGLDGLDAGGGSPDDADDVQADDVHGEAPAWRPEFGDDDLDGMLEVRSPLLARAFRGVDRPKP